MTITNQTVADKIAAYLHHDITLSELVDWAENAMMAEPFAKRDAAVLSDVVPRLGLANVRAFGLTWEDCERFLEKLGFRAKVEVFAGSSAPALVYEKPAKPYGK